MDQQVGNHHDGVVFLLADGHGDGGAVLAADNAVDGQGDAGPLVLLDAAVVVGLEVGNLGILIQGIGLQVHPGRIHMGRADIGALGQGLGADDGNQKALAPVVQKNLIAGLHRHTGDGRLKTVGDGLLGCPGSRFPFGFAGVHKGSIPFGVAFHFGALFGSDFLVAVLRLGEKGRTQFIDVHGVFLHYSVFC